MKVHPIAEDERRYVLIESIEKLQGVECAPHRHAYAGHPLLGLSTIASMGIPLT